MTPDKAQSLANDISCVIATLQEIADELAAAYLDSDYDRSEPKQEAPVSEPPKPAPKLEQLRMVFAEKSRAGHTAAVKTLLTKYDVAKLSELDTAHYAALLKEAEGIK